MIFVGYSGHAYVCIDTALTLGRQIVGYCDTQAVANNPYKLAYLGNEQSYLQAHHNVSYFISIGVNSIRAAVDASVTGLASSPLIHPSANISKLACVNDLVLVAMGANIQALAVIGRGSIINTGACVDHECLLGEFCHVGPNATLTGNVTLGNLAFVGAGATVQPGLTLGENSVLGSGAVLTKNLPPHQIWVGNPAHPIVSS